MPHTIRIGTSGWNYDHWRERFYPWDLPPDRWFRHYAKTFDTVEINNTFYQQPDESTLRRWATQAPRGFVYAVKANRYITHMKKLKDAADPLDKFFRSVRRLGAHLGPLLYQLPPNWSKNPGRLEAFIDLLPDEFTHVVEFRDRDWLADDTYALLAERGICLCVHDMLRNHPRRVTGSAVYVRFHGTGSESGGAYRRRRLEAWAGWMRDVAAGHAVFAYFNNDRNGYAIRNAQTLCELLDV